MTLEGMRAPAWHLKSTLDTGHSPEWHSTEHISSIPHHCPLQVSELSRTSPDTALLQYRHCVLLHLPQSSIASQGQVTALDYSTPR